MAKKDDNVKLYIIPDNFIEGGRVFNGMFRLKNFVEALILGGLFALIALGLPITTTTTRISVVIMFALPPFLLGIVGVNGDTLFSFLRNALRWKKNHSIMVYNDSTNSYDKAPLDVMMEQDLPKDKLVDFYSSWKSRRIEMENAKRATISYEFEEDEELSKLKQNKKQTSKKKSTPRTEKKKSKKDKSVLGQMDDQPQAANELAPEHEENVFDIDINEFSIDFDDDDSLTLDAEDLFSDDRSEIK